MNSLSITRPDDFHVHFRREPMLSKVSQFTAMNFSRALIMPNTAPDPILTGEDAKEYSRQIYTSLPPVLSGFIPLMTIQIINSTTPSTIIEAKRTGVIAGKVYPKGVTNNSHNGVSDFRALYPVFEQMQSVGMMLCIHGQKPGEFCLDREPAFLPTLQDIAWSFPGLRIVLEHISTRLGVEMVRSLPKNVAGSITAHHLVYTLDSVLSWDNGKMEGLNPHHYCQPIPQRPDDRDALVEVATSGNLKFFFGSDSAPHDRVRKVSDCGCAGVFSAPVAMPLLAERFEEVGRLKNLEAFTSRNGAAHYGLPENEGKLELAREEWKVPGDYDGVVPLYAGRMMVWKVIEW